MKNSAIYSMALASVLVLSLVDVEARGLGRESAFSNSKRPTSSKASASGPAKQPGSSNSKRLAAADDREAVSHTARLP